MKTFTKRTDATNFFTFEQALQELDALKFAVSALIDRYPNGSFERENARNAVKGIDHRINYLHDSFRVMQSEKGQPS